MTPLESAILQFIYKEYQNGNGMAYVIFSNFSDNLLDMNIALENLMTDGYIEVPRPAIGSAYVKLTEYGISFCEEFF